MRYLSLGCMALVVACRPTTANVTGAIYFPDEHDGVIPYRGGGVFAAGIMVTDSKLVGSSHGTLSLQAPTTSPGASAPQTIEIEIDEGTTGDAGLSGVATLTWPLGGPILVHAEALGVTIPDRTAPLTAPALDFGVPDSPTDTGDGWSYACCLQSTTDDGSVALHVEGATLANGTNDTTLTLTQGSCSGIDASPGTRSHAAYTLLVAGDATFHVNATMGTVLPPFIGLERTAPKHDAPVISLTSPSKSFGPGAIIEIDVHVQEGNAYAIGVPVQLEAVPPTQATTIVPATPTTNSSGDAVAHVQLPSTGSIEIDATIGSVRATQMFP